jgi:hypothetical protein
MKIVFVSSDHNCAVGSYRIWVRDLNKYFNEAGINSQITAVTEEVEKADVIIVSKNDSHLIQPLKEKYTDKIYGAINLASDNDHVGQDFIIVGSIEEKISLSHHPNVFYFPLIEDMFRDIPLKTHSNKKNLIFGYHGSHTHLCKFSPYLTTALEEFSETNPITLKIITSPGFKSWTVGIPKIPNITLEYWNYDTIEKSLRECDIGLVPNVTSMTPGEFDKTVTDPDLGLYSTDYTIRFKNKSNAGRAFVFHQLGIPVVADITPSNFHLLGDEQCGYLAHYKHSWLKAFENLKDPSHRTEVSRSAKLKFDQEYDPIQWAQKVYNEIRRIKNEPQH